VIREKTEYNDVKGMKEESGGKKVERFIRERENFVFDSLIYQHSTFMVKTRLNISFY